MNFRTFYRVKNVDKKELIETDSQNQAFRRMPDGGAVWKVLEVRFSFDKETRVFFRIEKRLA